jgi:hypothetical protein
MRISLSNQKYSKILVPGAAIKKFYLPHPRSIGKENIGIIA